MSKSGAEKALLADPKSHVFAGMDVPWLLEDRAARRPDHPFLIWEPFTGDTEVWTYARFLSDVNALAAGLRAKGVKQGDFLLIHLDNCPEILIAWYACAFLGAVGVTTNARSSGAELEYFASHSGSVAAITQPKFAQLVKDNCQGLIWIAVTETDNGEPPAAGAELPAGAFPFNDLLGDGDSFETRPADPMLPVGVQYTSGTTSRPKGVVWTHANALWGARIGSQQMKMTEDDVHLVYLPLFHTNAQSYSVLTSLWVGATCVIQPRFSASRFWEPSLKHKCTWTSYVPFCAKALLKHPVPEEHYYRLWGTGVAGAPWDPYFNVTTMGWWGMTETITQPIVSDPDFEQRPVVIGRPSAYYGIRVMTSDEADAVPVAPGQTGHLQVKGERGLSLFLEYLNNPVATNGSYTDDGWFITGDLVTLHEDGTIAFADRDKDMLKVGGENVAASEIEAIITQVPGVNEVAVVARKDDMLDEVPVAFVLPIDDAADDPVRAEALAEHVMHACEEALADFRIPREVRIVPELPRSTLEKIAKAQLRDQLNAEAG